MASKALTGIVKGGAVEVRFATSGKVSWVGAQMGDEVKKGQRLASLDSTLFQKRLDKELADYEEVRATFEIFDLKHKEPLDAETKFRKKQVQADLDISVKAVEIAKYELDQLTLLSPVNGVVTDNSNLVTGLNVTPASSPIKILDKENLYFSFEVNQESLFQFKESKEVKVEISDLDFVTKGKTKPAFLPASGKSSSFEIIVGLENTNGLLPGVKGKVTLA